MYGRNRLLDYFVNRIVLRSPKLRKAFQRAIYPSGIRNIDLLGQQFEIDVQSEIGYYRASIANKSNIFFRDEVPQLLTFVAAISHGMTIVDAGANIGTWTVTLASLGSILPGLRIMAFEPNPETFKRLQVNCARFPNVETINVALSDSEKILDFYETTVSGVFGTKASPFNPADPKRVAKVAAKPLDYFLSGHSSIAIKIDVEGHELEVLRGVQRSLENGTVKIVFSDGVDEENYSEFEAILKKNKFSCFNARSRKPFDGDELSHPVIAVRS